MSIEKSIQHFHFKLTNVWSASEKDIQAFKTIRDFVIDKNKKQIADNQLFAKLYVYVYAQYLKEWKATVFDSIPQKEFHKMLDRPFQAFVEAFRKQLNESELYELLETKGIELDHEVMMNLPQDKYNEQRQKESLILEDIKQEVKESDIWKYEDVESNLVAQINAVLNEIKC